MGSFYLLSVARTRCSERENAAVEVKKTKSSIHSFPITICGRHAVCQARGERENASCPDAIRYGHISPTAGLHHSLRPVWVSMSNSMGFPHLCSRDELPKEKEKSRMLDKSS